MAQIYIPQTPVRPVPDPNLNKPQSKKNTRGIGTDRPATKREQALFKQKSALSANTGPGSSFADRTQGFMGLSLEIIPIQQGGLSVFPSTPIIFGLTGGAYHNIKNWKDFYGLGIDLSAVLTFNYSSFSGLTFYNQVPLYFVARLGARTTRYNDNRLGAMLGVGATFNYLVLPYSVNTSNNQVARLEQAYFAPAAMFQVTINQSTYNIWALRFHANLAPYRVKDFTPQGSPITSDLTYQNFGVSLIYYFK